MGQATEYQKNTVEFIKNRIRILNGIVLLITVIALVLILRLLYDFLDHMPLLSVISILTLMAGLTFSLFLLARIISQKAIRSIDEYSSKLSDLLTTTGNLHRFGYIDVLLEEILNIGMEMTKAQGGSLFLVEGDSLAFKKVRGSKTEKLTAVSVWVAEHGLAVRIDDAESDHRFHPEVDSRTGSQMNSVLCVPLKIHSGVIGALELVCEKRRAFTPADEEVLVYFAEQAALSIVKVKFQEERKNYEIHLTELLVDAIENISQKRGHAKRVTMYALQMAEASNMSEEEKSRLHRACMLHDIGFLKIKLEEVQSIHDYESHTEVGREMLQPINVYADILPMIRHHHERYDGTGYPSGLKGESIPLESRLICVADAFDAMVSPQSYKNVEPGKVMNEHVFPSVVGLSEALTELEKNAGSQFDPELVRLFKQIVRQRTMV